MRSTCLAILVLVFHMTAKAYVVNHEFCSACLSEEEKEEKETLEEVHTFAQLKRNSACEEKERRLNKDAPG